MKQIYNQGKKHSEYKKDLENMLAIHHFDFAVEMLLKILGEEFSINIDYDIRFDDLWSRVNDKYKKVTGNDLPLKARMKNLHNLRNILD